MRRGWPPGCPGTGDAMSVVRGKTVRMYYPLPTRAEAERIVAEHTRLRRWPAECRCGAPYASCWQRLGALEVLSRSSEDVHAHGA